MKNALQCGLLLMLLAGCQTNRVAEPRGPASVALSDAAYNFSPAKVHAARDPYYFARSFVDYFYLLTARNGQSLNVVKNFSAFSGNCVGDAHPENFGFLIQESGESKFAMNDMDDFGPCPVAYDLYRFMVMATIDDANTDLGSLLSFYVRGLRGDAIPMPDALLGAQKTSRQQGTAMDPGELENAKFPRNKTTVDVDAAVAGAIKSYLAKANIAGEILDIVESIRVGGGSGGRIRYEVALKQKKSLLHLEFKEEIQSSIYPVATGDVTNIENKIMGALKAEQGPGYSHYYGYALIGDKEMLVRPYFPGNTGVSLIGGAGEMAETLNYEAYILGQIHRAGVAGLDKYITAIQNSSADEWRGDVAPMALFIKAKFQSFNP